MNFWAFGILIIIHSMESMANERDYNNTIGMMCAYDRSGSGYFYLNIGEGQASNYAWNFTFGTNRKIIFYIKGYGEDMHPEGKDYVPGEGKVDSFADVAKDYLFDNRSMICLFDYKHKKDLGPISIVLDFRNTARNRVPLVAKIVKELALEMYTQKVFSTFDELDFIGFSMGAHIAGTTARMIKSEQGHEIPRIFALDAAKTLIRNYSHELRRSDARYIQAIYTSSVSKQDLDVHCKIFINDGANQEGCEGNYLMFRDFCNHCYLLDLYDEIGAKARVLIGYMDPDRNGDNYKIGAVLVGHPYQDNSTGVYYANTDGSKLKKKWLG